MRIDWRFVAVSALAGMMMALVWQYFGYPGRKGGR